MEEANHKNELRRQLESVSYASDTLVPDVEKDFGDTLNFIDENEYNTKVKELIDSRSISKYYTGEWYFSHANQLEVSYPDISGGVSFSLTFDYDLNKVTIDGKTAGFPYSTTFDNAADPPE